MSGKAKMECVWLAVGSPKGENWLSSDLPTGVYSGVGTASPYLFALVTLLQDLDFSFQFPRVAPGAT